VSACCAINYRRRSDANFRRDLAAAAIVASSSEAAAVTVTLGASSAWSAARPIVAGAVVNAIVSIGGVALGGGPLVVAGGTLAGNALTSLLARIPRWFQNGDGQGYMAWFAIGAAVLVVLA